MGQNQTQNVEENVDELAQKYEEIKFSAKESIEKAKKKHSKPYMMIIRD